MVYVLKIRDIGSNVYAINKQIIINLFISIIINKKKVITHLRRETHIIDNLKINILLKIDTLALEKILLNFKDKTTIIDSYNIKIDVIITPKSIRLRKPLFYQSRITIPVYGSTKILIEVYKFLLNNKDYIFEPKYNRIFFFISVVDANLSFINIINDTKFSFIIPARTRLDEIQDYNYNKYYYINVNAASLAKVIFSRVKSASQTN